MAPEQLVENGEDISWFKVLVMHQNRWKGKGIGAPSTFSIQENDLPRKFDLVIWGHEHECFTEPWKNPLDDMYIFQPGSTVATSLIEAEAKQKHAYIIEVRANK